MKNKRIIEKYRNSKQYLQIKNYLEKRKDNLNKGWTLFIGVEILTIILDLYGFLHPGIRILMYIFFPIILWNIILNFINVKYDLKQMESVIYDFNKILILLEEDDQIKSKKTLKRIQKLIRRFVLNCPYYESAELENEKKVNDAFDLIAKKLLIEIDPKLHRNVSISEYKHLCISLSEIFSSMYLQKFEDIIARYEYLKEKNVQKESLLKKFVSSNKKQIFFGVFIIMIILTLIKIYFTNPEGVFWTYVLGAIIAVWSGVQYIIKKENRS
ncbi:hypothetical protein J4410_06435 [Candidatus Woesearchaeota archaeon]|nr:hypothetical protein [Candidatus Woesearchaeota archaeon]